MIPHRKIYETKSFQELNGWRQGEKSSKPLKSPLNVIKPYRVNSLSDFHTSPKYPDYTPESPWLPILTPRPAYSLLTPYNSSNQTAKLGPAELGHIYETEKPKMLHRPNVFSLSTRSNESGGNFHSCKGSFDFTNIEYLESKKLEMPEPVSATEVKGFNLRSGQLEEVETRISSHRANQLDEEKVKKFGVRTKNLLKVAKKEHFRKNSEGKIKDQKLEKNEVGTSQSFEHRQDLQEFQDNAEDFLKGFQGAKVIHLDRKELSEPVSNEELREVRSPLYPAQILPINSNFILKDRSLQGQSHSADTLPQISKIRHLPAVSSKLVIKNPPSLAQDSETVQNNSESPKNFQFSSPLYPENPPSLPFGPDSLQTSLLLTRNKSKLQQKRLEIIQIIDLAPVEEASKRHEAALSSGRSPEPESAVHQEEKVLRRQSNLNRNSQKSSVRNTLKSQSQAWEDEKDERSEDHLIRNSLEIQLKAEKKEEKIQDFELLEEKQKNPKPDFFDKEKQKNPKPDFFDKEKQKNLKLENEKKGKSDKNEAIEKPERKIRDSKGLLVRDSKVQDNDALKKPQAKIRSKGKKETTKYRRTSSMVQSQENLLQVPKRREKRRSTSGNDKKNLLDEPFEYRNSVDRFIHNYSQSIISLLTITYVSLKENIESIAEELDRKGTKRDSVKRPSLLKELSHRRSKFMRRRMKIELSVIMKPSKKNGKIDSNKIIDNLKTSIFSEGVKKDLITIIKNKETTHKKALTKKMNSIINNRIRSRPVSEINDSRSVNRNSSRSEEEVSGDEGQGSGSEENEAQVSISLKPDYKKANLIKFLNDNLGSNGSYEKIPSSRGSFASQHSGKPLKVVENDLEEVDFSIYPYIFSENHKDIDEELASMSWCSSKYIKRFLFSSQVQQDLIRELKLELPNDHGFNDYEEGLDLLNLEYRMLKKRFYDMQGLGLNEEDPDYKLVITDPWQMSDLDSKRFEIEKVRKYLRQLKYLKNKPKNFVHKPQSKTFSGLLKVEGSIVRNHKNLGVINNN